MEFSVVVPTCNRRDWIGQALDSIAGQTLPPLEVIVVDDGSTDDTAGYIRRHYPQVRLLVQENRGVSHARNRGIEAARGEWVALLDSDDAWRPEKLARQAQRLAEPGAPPVCHTDEIWIRNRHRVNPMRKHAKPEGWILRDCLPLCCVSPSSVAIHRNVFNQAGLFDETLPACEDYDLWLRIFARYPVALVPEQLVIKHGGHDDQLSRRHWGMDRFRIRALCKLLDNVDLSEGDRQAVLNTLAGKIKLYVQGAEKRGRHEEVRRYRALRAKYLSPADAKCQA